MTQIIFLLVLLAWYWFTSAYGTKKLIYVHVIHRHGSRSPKSSYGFPNDPYNNYTWENNNGSDMMLTERGKRELKKLGQYLRSEYISSGTLTLNERNLENDLYVRCSPKTRCHESFAALLEGLALGEPVPIDGEQEKQAWLTDPISATCERFTDLVELHREVLNVEVMTSPKYKQFLVDLVRYTGYNIQNKPWNLKTITSNIAGVLICERYEFYDSFFNAMPWLLNHTIEYGGKQLGNMYSIIQGLKYLAKEEDLKKLEKVKLVGGYLLHDIIQRLSTAADGGKSPKMTIYSSHDNTLLILLYIMQTGGKKRFPVPWPNFAASLYFELWYQPAKQLYTVKIKLKQNPLEDRESAKLVGIPTCRSSPYDLTKKWLPATVSTIDEMNKNCKNPDLLVEGRWRLKYVHALVRHGSRGHGQNNTFPTDPFIAWLPDKSLTDRGMKEMKLLGKFLKTRYMDEYKLANSNNAKQKIYVCSSNEDRCLVTAQQLLEGMELDKKDIDINASPAKIDSICRPNKVNCPKYKERVEKEQNETLELLNKNPKYQDYYKYMTEKTKWTVDAQKAIKLGSILTSELNEFPEIFYEKMPWLAKRYIYQRVDLGNYYEVTLAIKKSVRKCTSEWHNDNVKLIGGRLLYDIVQKLIDASQNKLNYSFVIYSTVNTKVQHAETQKTVMYGMKTFSTSYAIPKVAYGASLYFELWAHPTTKQHKVYITIKQNPQDTKGKKAKPIGFQNGFSPDELYNKLKDRIVETDKEAEKACN